MSAEAYEQKMMLNDVAIQISDLDKIPEQDSYNQISVVISLPYHLIKKLSVSCRENPEIIKRIIEEYFEKLEIQHHAASLSFDGKKPRKDVLIKLLGIAVELEQYNSFPNFKRRNLENCIKTKLANPDPRTLKKYIDCITVWVEKKTGRRVYFDQDYDLFDFKEVILYKLKEPESTEIICGINKV